MNNRNTLAFLLLLCNQTYHIKPVTEDGVIVGTLTAGILGGILGGTLCSSKANEFNYKYNSSRNSFADSFIIGGVITGLFSALLTYLALSEMTPKRRFDRAYSIIANYRNHILIKISKNYSSIHNASCVSTVTRAYVSYDYPLLRAIFALESICGELATAKNLLHMAKSDIVRESSFYHDCSQLSQEAGSLRSTALDLLAFLKEQPEYSYQLRAYKAEVESAQLREQIRNSTNQLANELRWKNINYYIF